MTLEDIEKVLTRSYKRVNYAEDPNQEQAYYNRNINKLRKALENGKIKPEDIKKEDLSYYITDGFDIPEDDVREDY